MSLKEKLEKLKIKILDSSLPVNRDYEFDAELEDHQLGNQRIYRLYYINYHRINEYQGRFDNNVGIINWPFQPFVLPEGMSREDGFKVLSYLTDFIEKEMNLEPRSHKSVSTLNSVLDLERLGFKRINKDIDDNDIIDLFTVSGRLLLFKKSKHYQKYFEWYTEGITFDEVKTIYNNCGVEFYNLSLSENSEEMKTENSNSDSKLIKEKKKQKE